MEENQREIVEISSEQELRNLIDNRSNENIIIKLLDEINIQLRYNESFEISNWKLIGQNINFNGTINLVGGELETYQDLKGKIKFYNCSFELNISFKYIEIYEIRFSSCQIHKRIEFDFIAIYDIIFENIKKSEGFIYLMSVIVENNCVIYENPGGQELESILNFSIYYSKLIKNLILRSVNFNSVELQNINELFKFEISNCEFNKLHFMELDVTDFHSSYSIIKNNFIINYCNFIGKSTFFSLNKRNQIYYSEPNIYKLNGEENLKISNSFFHSNTSFDNSIFKSANFEICSFKEATSFNNFETDNFNIERTGFEKIAFINLIKINNLKNCNRETVNLIKQQFLKVENKIDANKYKILEFDAYQKELREKSKNKDLYLLQLHKTVSNYGTDWVRALIFVLISGFIFYNIFYLIFSLNRIIEINGSLCYEFKWANNYFGGLFRYVFAITDFHNPLISDKKEFLESGIDWIPFILGKICIAFGIYELVQSFRKFSRV